MYDVIIVGGGPAGCAAAVYTGRKKLKTLLITAGFGGQSIVSADIQNWIGEMHVSGFELANKLEAHVRAYADSVNIRQPEIAVEIEKTDCNEETGVCYPPGMHDFKVKTDKSEYWGKTVILTSGAGRRKLNVSGEKEFDGKGVSYCSTCDAPIFQGKTVAVIGGGNAGLEAVVDLIPYAQKIYLLEYTNALKGDSITQEEVKKNSKVEIVFNTETREITGDKFVSGLRYHNRETKKDTEISLEGVFVEIGSVPNSKIAKGLVELDGWGHIKIDSKYGTTSCPGFFAAGDVTDDPFKQNNIAVGDAVKCALSAHAYLLKRQ